MSAPKDKTLKDLSGKWSMDKSLSTDPSPVLKLQGHNILIQKAAASAPITLNITQPNPDTITIDQKTAASIPAIKEQWRLDWEWREQDDSFLGKVRSRSRWHDRDQIEGSEFLKEEVEEDEVVEAEVEGLGDVKWWAKQVWGFNVEDGKRVLVRRVVTGKADSDERVETKLVYTWDR